MRTTISTRGQLVLPAEVRQEDEIEAGQVFEVERLDRGVYRIERIAPTVNEAIVDWLLSCPDKGYFVPVEFELTDAL